MTPFESFYSVTIAKNLPSDYPPRLAAAGKEAMLTCWNAAIDAAIHDSKERHPLLGPDLEKTLSNLKMRRSADLRVTG